MQRFPYCTAEKDRDRLRHTHSGTKGDTFLFQTQMERHFETCMHESICVHTQAHTCTCIQSQTENLKLSMLSVRLTLLAGCTL
jgi:hypothetical protein